MLKIACRSSEDDIYSKIGIVRCSAASPADGQGKESIGASDNKDVLLDRLIYRPPLDQGDEQKIIRLRGSSHRRDSGVDIGGRVESCDN